MCAQHSFLLGIQKKGISFELGHLLYSPLKNFQLRICSKPKQSSRSSQLLATLSYETTEIKEVCLPLGNSWLTLFPCTVSTMPEWGPLPSNPAEPHPSLAHTPPPSILLLAHKAPLFQYFFPRDAQTSQNVTYPKTQRAKQKGNGTDRPPWPCPLPTAAPSSPTVLGGAPTFSRNKGRSSLGASPGT